jgi:tetrahydrodipicolinate N-succinyltransferase
MKVRNLLTVNAIYVGLAALVALLAPTVFLEMTGLDVSQSTINLERAYGALAVGYAVTSWLMRNEPASGARRAFLIGAGTTYIVFAAVNIVNINALIGLGTVTPGWAIFVINLIFGIAFLYFAFRKPASE